MQRAASNRRRDLLSIAGNCRRLQRNSDLPGSTVNYALNIRTAIIPLGCQHDRYQLMVIQTETIPDNSVTVPKMMFQAWWQVDLAPAASDQYYQTNGIEPQLLCGRLSAFMFWFPIIHLPRLITLLGQSGVSLPDYRIRLMAA